MTLLGKRRTQTKKTFSSVKCRANILKKTYTQKTKKIKTEQQI